MDEYKIEDWQTFNEFFVREIKEDRRPVDAKDEIDVVVAPADCVINMIVDDLTATTQIPVKTVSMNINQLLANSEYRQVHRRYGGVVHPDARPIPLVPRADRGRGGGGLRGRRRRVLRVPEPP
ncbi:hypothetical protein M878_11880 [Streptomyces roseochromogenus subsp. oscitans DS 12.976]|uniref:Uncharacterized protein n=1 Tax=Streptomyces roseochromogenus subsp. oscitans DS 12.976 TaxID=1352936 RepID=V6KXN7_STRRC|nr:hypothetical protein M878_11880 [Streptomyces roseochromogenus subsp. oscitans DS 12.976]